MDATLKNLINYRPVIGRAKCGRTMSKPYLLVIFTAIVGLASTGLIWMISTLVTVDKRTEIMDIKIDHLVQAVEKLTERQASFDKSWSNVVPGFKISTGGN